MNIIYKNIRTNGVKVWNKSNGIELYAKDGKYPVGTPTENLSIEEIIIRAKPNVTHEPPIITHEIKKEAENLHTKPKLHTGITHELKKGEGIANSRFAGYYVINGVQYPSVRIAERITGVKAKTIFNRCKKGIKGYSFVARPSL